jgi:hypothetical protein
MQTAAASLVAALPAGILAALLVMMFLSHAENLKGLLPIFIGIALIPVAAVVLMPFGILLFSGKAAAKAAPKVDKKSANADDEELVSDDDGELVADEDGEIGETVEFEGGSSSDVEVFDDEAFDDEALEATDDELFDDEEDVKPKKKGKKK